MEEESEMLEAKAQRQEMENMVGPSLHPASPSGPRLPPNLPQVSPGGQPSPGRGVGALWPPPVAAALV